MECVRARALSPRSVTSRNTIGSFGEQYEMAEPFAPGQLLNEGRYRIVREINRKTDGVHCAETLSRRAGGATAVVYEAEDSARGSGRVALKVTSYSTAEKARSTHACPCEGDESRGASAESLVQDGQTRSVVSLLSKTTVDIDCCDDRLSTPAPYVTPTSFGCSTSSPMGTTSSSPSVACPGRQNR